MDPNPDPGVPVPPAEPAAPAVAEPPVREDVTNPGEQSVPFSRFQEVNDKAKADAERVTELERQLEEVKTPPPVDDDNPDPEVEKLLDSYAKRKGLVSQEELAAERNKITVQQDVNDLTATPPNPGIPYDNKAVVEFAKANNMPLTSKAALKAAYRELNYDKIVEAERQRAIDGFKKAGNSGAEQPGSGGPTPPVEPELKSKDPKSRTRERINLARQKLLA